MNKLKYISFENMLKRNLDEIIESANKALTIGERAELLVLIAQKMKLEPKHMVRSPPPIWRDILGDWFPFNQSYRPLEPKVKK